MLIPFNLELNSPMSTIQNYIVYKSFLITGENQEVLKMSRLCLNCCIYWKMFYIIH